MSNEPQVVRDKLQDKANRVAAAAAATSQRAFSTPYGEVRFGAISSKQDADGLYYVEVWLSGSTASGDPHFRIYNPPLLAQDPRGSVEVNGVRYREDPLAAIAEAVARRGGARKKSGPGR